jgi:hypothetical protein
MNWVVHVFMLADGHIYGASSTKDEIRFLRSHITCFLRQTVWKNGKVQGKAKAKINAFGDKLITNRNDFQCQHGTSRFRRFGCLALL